MFAFNDDHLSGQMGLGGFSLGGKSFLLGKYPAAPVLSPFGLSPWSQATHISFGQKVLASSSSLSLSSASLLLSSLSVTRMFPPGQRSSWELVISSLWMQQLIFKRISRPILVFVYLFGKSSNLTYPWLGSLYVLSVSLTTYHKRGRLLRWSNA